MGFEVAEIRARAEELKSDLARERYETKSGRAERPNYTALYAAHGLLLDRDVIPAIQRELAEATGEEQRRLQYLLAWVAEQQVEAPLAPLEDEQRAWEAGTVVSAGDREVPYRSVARTVRNTEDRGVRLALEEARYERLEEAYSLQVDTVHREREALDALGLGGYVEARERLSCLDVTGLEWQVSRILTATEDGYRAHLAHQARGRLGIDPADLRRSDVEWLGRMRWLDGYFALPHLLEGVRRDLESLGLPLSADGRLRLDLGDRPLKVASFCAPIRVPDDVVLVVAPSGGRPDCVSLLHEMGHALHFTWTDPDIPFEYRALGDTAVTEAFALLLESLSLDRSWLRRVPGLQGRELNDYLLLAGFLQSYVLRRRVAKLLYQLELWRSGRPAEMGARYEELMGDVTGVRHDRRAHLEEVDRGFWVARQLRGWMLWAVLSTALRDRYDQDWYRNPSAGPFLRELFAAGQREDASRLARELGGGRLGLEPLLERARAWLP